jgi:hypothetical protein
MGTIKGRCGKNCKTYKHRIIVRASTGELRNRITINNLTIEHLKKSINDLELNNKELESKILKHADY